MVKKAVFEQFGKQNPPIFWDKETVNSLFVALDLESLDQETKNRFLRLLLTLTNQVYLNLVFDQLSSEEGQEFLKFTQEGNENAAWEIAQNQIPNLKKQLINNLAKELKETLKTN